MSSGVRLIPFGGAWRSAGAVTIRGVGYALTFNRGTGLGPTLTLTAAEGAYGGTVYTAFLDCCGCGYATFVIPAALCDGAAACGGPCANQGRITVRYAACAFTGAGWYCARDCGTDDAPAVVELLEADAGDASVEIVSGPYTSRTAAALACGAAGGTTCDDATTVPIGSAGALLGTALGAAGERWFRVPLVAGTVYSLTAETYGVAGAQVQVTGLPGVYGTSSGCVTFTSDVTGLVCVKLVVEDTLSGVAFVLSSGAC